MAPIVDDKHMSTDGYRRGGVGEVVMGNALGHDPNLPGTIASAYRGDHHADLAYQCLTTHHRSLPTSAPRGAARRVRSRLCTHAANPWSQSGLSLGINEHLAGPRPL